MNLGRNSWTVCFFAYCFVLLDFTFGAEQAVDLEALSKLGLQQRERLRTNAALWTVVLESPDGTRRNTIVAQDGTRKRITVSLDAGGKILEGFQLTERDGVWYVADKLGRRKCRPFEASFYVPGAYEAILEAEVAVLDSPTKLEGAKLESIQNNVAQFRLPLPATSRAYLQAYIEEVTTAMKRDAFLANARPESRFKKTLAHHERILRDGMHATVDLSTGAILEFDDYRVKTFLKDFRWLDSSLEKDFAVDEHKWEDKTPLVFTPGFEEFIMAWGRFFMVDDDADEKSDLHIINLQSSEIRRVPFRGISDLGGCFLMDRSRVIIPGLSIADRKLRPYEVNLQTGNQRPLGGEAIATGNSGNFILSNDGKTVAFQHETNRGTGRPKQLYLLDLATDKARPIGEPMEVLLSSWLPGDRTLLAQIKEDAQGAKNLRHPTICLIDLKGEVRMIRDGAMPVWLSAAQRILYLDTNDRLWHTCDLKGWHTKLFHGGLPNHGQQAVAPDGKRVMLLKDRAKQPSVAYVYEDDDGDGKPIKLPSGNWSFPIWK